MANRRKDVKGNEQDVDENARQGEDLDEQSHVYSFVRFSVIA